MLGRVNSGSWVGPRELRRGLADFMLALSLFWVAALTVSGDIRAHAIPLPALSKQVARPDVAALSQATLRGAESTDAVYGLRKTEAGPQPALALFLLSMAFAALVAGNLAFWRHLRRVYASPRRSVWRRG